jgi:hypothetical protein
MNLFANNPASQLLTGRRDPARRRHRPRFVDNKRFSVRGAISWMCPFLAIHVPTGLPIVFPRPLLLNSSPHLPSSNCILLWNRISSVSQTEVLQALRHSRQFLDFTLGAARTMSLTWFACPSTFRGNAIGGTHRLARTLHLKYQLGLVSATRAEVKVTAMTIAVGRVSGTIRPEL